MAVKVVFRNEEGKRNGSEIYANATAWQVGANDVLYIENAAGNWEATIAAGSWNHVEFVTESDV